MAQPLPKGWFKIAKHQDGDRTVEEQLAGLEPLFDLVVGKSVLDLGCAEGLIARALADAGAKWVLGVDARAAAVMWANRHLAVTGRCGFIQGDLNDASVAANADYDVVLLLSIAHKLADPRGFIVRVAGRARETIAIRLPGPVITRVGAGAANKRDLAAPVDVPLLMRDLGWAPWRECPHPRREWTVIYRRAGAATP